MFSEKKLFLAAEIEWQQLLSAKIFLPGARDAWTTSRQQVLAFVCFAKEAYYQNVEDGGLGSILLTCVLHGSISLVKLRG